MELEKKICNVLEEVREFTHLDDIISVDGCCDAILTIGKDSGVLTFMWESHHMEREILLNLKWTVYKRGIRPAILHWNNLWLVN